MPRDAPLGNGRLYVCFDRLYRIRDLCFPHVGQENHVSGNLFRFGVRAGEEFSWVDEEWRLNLDYEEDALVARAELYSERLGLLLRCRDAVDFHENIYVREVSVENLRPETRTVELFFSQDFDIAGNSVGDTAAFDPKTGGLTHYKGRRYFLIGGCVGERDGFSQYAVGVKRTGDKEGTWRDAEDGRLSGNAVAQGSVDSVVSLAMEVEGLGEASAWYWICAAQDWTEARRLDGRVRHKRPAALLKRTADYWRLWARKESPALDALSPKAASLYPRSLLVLFAHCDWNGGVVAANDSDVIQFNRDTYSYVWPRDGALAAHALDQAGYPSASRRFFQFCVSAVGEEGALMHKYSPDGSLASSWHPWFEDGREQLPIQEDETGLVLWALWKHFALYRDIDFIKPLYRPLVKRCANFLASYRDAATGLPAPSYDLWEERRGVNGFTVGAVFGGLTAASIFCSLFGEENRAEDYRRAAADIRDACSKHLWREELGRFCRMVHLNGTFEVDPSRDASLLGLWMFGVYDRDDARMEATVAALREGLWLKSATGGLARYENDPYYRVDQELPGNPWFVTTLWLADWLTASPRPEDQAEALSILDWTASHALPSGALAEQLHPHTGVPLSVSPLAWSHAGYIISVNAYLRRVAPERPGATRSEDWITKLFGETCDRIHGTCRIK